MQKADFKIRTAFTLLEVMAVVLLLSLAAAATMWSMADSVNEYSAENIASVIAGADTAARLAARNRDRQVSLVFDLDREAIMRVVKDDIANEKIQSHTTRFPKGFAIDTIITANAAHHTFGTTEILYSREGFSSNYAVKLVCNDTVRWLFVCGLSGEIVRINEDQDVYKLFALSSEYSQSTYAR